MAATHGDLIRRKIGASKTRKLELSMQGAISESLQTAVVKCGAALRGVAVEGLVESCEVVAMEVMLDALPEASLIWVLTRGDGGGHGLFVLERDTVGHLVEIATGTGGIGGLDRGGRAVTAIDAALCRPFANMLMERFRATLADAVGQDALGRFETAWHETAAGPLVHKMPRGSYVVFRLALDIGEDGRTGVMRLVLPAAPFREIDVERATARHGADRAAAALWRRHMEDAAGASVLAMNAVLGRLSLPLARAAALRPGEVVELPDTALGDVRVELATGNGPVPMLRGRLGQFGGRKVVKVTAVGAGRGGG
ncbi:MAG: FliM/FliN family flagellar motor switch protein [Paracoccaceae bacterium]